jgi:Tol biopolymer transport system component
MRHLRFIVLLCLLRGMAVVVVAQDGASDDMTEKIVWASWDGDSSDEGMLQLYMMNLDGTDMEQLTFAEESNSPDALMGEGRVVFHRFTTDSPAVSELFMLDVATMEETRLTLSEEEAYNYNPKWSPDGVHIVFYSYRLREGDWASDIYVLNTETGEETAITTNGMSNGGPDWSPDGTRIAFHSYMDTDEGAEIYVYDLEEETFTRLTDNDYTDAIPMWSPDGERLLFWAAPDEDRDLYVMDADGDNVVQLTDTLGSDWQAEWSPDGERIVFISERDGDSELFIMDADGGNVEQITDNDVRDSNPTWLSYSGE